MLSSRHSRGCHNADPWSGGGDVLGPREPAVAADRLGRDSSPGLLAVVACVLAAAQRERTGVALKSTGRCLMPATIFERRRAGAPSDRSTGTRRASSSNNTRISSRARLAPRQKCGPPPPKATCSLGRRSMSKRNGSAMARSRIRTAISRMRGSSALIRRGVKPRLTSFRYLVCSGGSIAIRTLAPGRGVGVSGSSRGVTPPRSWSDE